MLLSAEQFCEITGHLISDKSGKSVEKRREPRVGVRFEAVVTGVAQGSSANQKRIMIRDLSRSGINLLSHDQMPKGTEFMMKLQRADQRQITAVYRVCHCKPLGPTQYAVGAVLLTVSDGTTKVAA